MKLKRAMRYYRLWIYACNAVLITSVLAFISAAVAILADPRRHLSSAFALSQPSFLYAYLALFLQGTVVPIVGCLGAIRLSPRWLQVYWLSLLFLLGGDILLGIVWIFRFQKVVADLLPELKENLALRYGTDPEFSRAWDELQMASHCCGAGGPVDFNETVWLKKFADNGWLVPESCCRRNQKLNGQQRPKNEVHPGRSETWGTGKQYKEHGHQYRGNQAHHTNPFLYTTNAFKQATLQQQQQQQQQQLHHNKHASSVVNTSTAKKTYYNTRQNSAMYQDLFTPFALYSSSQSVTQQPVAVSSPRRTSRRERTLRDSVSSVRSTRSTFDSSRNSTHPTSTPDAPHGTNTTSNGTGVLMNRLQRSVHEPFPAVNHSSTTANDNLTTACWQSSYSSSDIQSLGCGEDLVHWVEQSADILIVLGFCVLSFIKLCFLAILHYELREMLQKIKVLRGETIHQFPELTAAIAISSLASPLQPSLTPNSSHVLVPSMALETETFPVNGTLVQQQQQQSETSDSCGVGILALPDKSSPEASSSKSPPDPVTPPSFFNRFHHQLPDGGADSDTGSHCGLLTDKTITKDLAKDKLVRDWDRSKEREREMSRGLLLLRDRDKGWPAHSSRPNGNNNEYHELREMPLGVRQTQI